ncbi:MAG: hypothetical protein ACXWP0_08935, partial [Ktedonobacterales bacterium]
MPHRAIHGTGGFPKGWAQINMTATVGNGPRATATTEGDRDRVEQSWANPNYAGAARSCRPCDRRG